MRSSIRSTSTSLRYSGLISSRGCCLIARSGSAIYSLVISSLPLMAPVPEAAVVASEGRRLALLPSPIRHLRPDALDGQLRVLLCLKLLLFAGVVRIGQIPDARPIPVARPVARPLRHRSPP